MKKSTKIILCVALVAVFLGGIRAAVMFGNYDSFPPALQEWIRSNAQKAYGSAKSDLREDLVNLVGEEYADRYTEISKELDGHTYRLYETLEFDMRNVTGNRFAKFNRYSCRAVYRLYVRVDDAPRRYAVSERILDYTAFEDADDNSPERAKITPETVKTLYKGCVDGTVFPDGEYDAEIFANAIFEAAHREYNG